MATYLIQDATMSAIADQVRRLTGTNAPLSPAQMATALAAFSPGSGYEDFDSFRFYDFVNYGVSDIGNSGLDEDGNVLTPFTAFPYLERYMVGPASTSYSASILSKFNPADIQSGKQRETLTEIKMPVCTSISAFEFVYSNNLVSAYFPACMSVGHDAFHGRELLESLTLNSACTIAYDAFTDVLAPESKTFKLYLRGTTVGTCSDTAFGSVDTGSCNYVPVQEFYSGPVPGLEIYVPANLLNSFKTTWANGGFADNIYALTD